MNSSTSGCVHVLIFHFAYDKTNEHNIQQYPFSLKSTHVQQNTLIWEYKKQTTTFIWGVVKSLNTYSRLNACILRGSFQICFPWIASFPDKTVKKKTFLLMYWRGLWHYVATTDLQFQALTCPHFAKRMELLPFSLLPLLTRRQVEMFVFSRHYLERKTALNREKYLFYSFEYALYLNLKLWARWMKIVFVNLTIRIRRFCCSLSIWKSVTHSAPVPSFVAL